MEQFAIPGVGGIIVKSIDNIDYILIQERWKTEAPNENGLLEFLLARYVLLRIFLMHSDVKYQKKQVLK